MLIYIPLLNAFLRVIILRLWVILRCWERAEEGEIFEGGHYVEDFRRIQFFFFIFFIFREREYFWNHPYDKNNNKTPAVDSALAMSMGL